MIAQTTNLETMTIIKDVITQIINEDFLEILKNVFNDKISKITPSTTKSLSKSVLGL